MFVLKRDGRQEPVHFDKITSRIKNLTFGLPRCDAAIVAQKVIKGMASGMATSALDDLAAETAAYMSTEHPDYAILGGRIAVSNLHKMTQKQFSAVMRAMHDRGMISDSVAEFVSENAAALDAAVVHDRDFDFDLFAIKTLTKAYLLKIDGKIVERPQHMFMRVAVGIHSDVSSAIETYDLMSRRFFVHATPTLFNAGTRFPQMSSCFLLRIKDDSINGIFETLKDCADISKLAGGIGLSIHDIRAKGAHIAGTNGTSNGIVPMLRVFDACARYVDQGGGKRKGSIAIYLEPWHADVEDFLELKKNSGKEETRARDLFYALWIPDLFMKRVEAGSTWTLFCPSTAPGLADVYGAEFDRLYERYEREGRGRKTIPAQQLWFQILTSQIETGTPYIMYKDACNSKSNQKNLGTIRSSNLCTEIVQYTSEDEIAVCNLASISLKAFVRNGAFDFQELIRVTRIATRNLNKVIDRNFYPVPEAKRSNLRHRPIGLGVQGLADCFLELDLAFESAEAKKLNAQIFETIYYAALCESVELARAHGPYDSFQGSPASEGILQFDMWNVKPSMYDWDALKRDVVAVGLRNSLLVAPMPTASTSQILGNNECIEPFTSNIFSRRVLAGDFVVVNKYLVRVLSDMGKWNNETRDKIIATRGSVQSLTFLPSDVRERFKTVWEIKQRAILDMAADRAAFVDQSQSLNVFIAEPTVGKLTSMLFYGWRLGLKTGCYYLRTLPKVNPIAGLGAETKSEPKPADEDCVTCSA